MRNHSFIFLILFLISACNVDFKEKPESVSTEGKEVNYALMLDLSERISTDSLQIQRDILLIKLLYQKFQHQMLDTMNAGSFQVIIPSQEQFQNQIAIFEDLLSLKIKSQTIENRESTMAAFEEKLDEVLAESYQFSLNYLSKSDFKKVDIWSFFKNQLVNKLDSDAQNYLFVFTDGYLSSENEIKKGNRYQSTLFLEKLRHKNWEAVFAEKGFGLEPIEKQFDKLAVMVLEFKPKAGFEFELEILKKTWSNWLLDMEVKDHKILGRLPLEEIQTEITEFLGDDLWKFPTESTVSETGTNFEPSELSWGSVDVEDSTTEMPDNWDTWEDEVEAPGEEVKASNLAKGIEPVPSKKKKIVSKPSKQTPPRIKPPTIDINPGPTFVGYIDYEHTEYLEETFNRMVSVYDSRVLRHYKANIERYFERGSQIVQYGKSSGRKLKNNSTRLFLMEARVSQITIDSMHLGNNGKIKTLFISDK